MTEEIFEKAYALNEEIKACKKILEAMDSHYEKTIRLDYFVGKISEPQIIRLCKEPELEMYIREYFIHKLEVSEQEFAKLK